MTQALRQETGQVTYANGTGSAVVAGQPIDLTDRVGIAAGAIADGASGIAFTKGIFRLAKNASTSFAQGADVDWDLSAEQCDELGVGETGDLLHIGKCVTAVTTESYIDVDINIPVTMTTVG